MPPSRHGRDKALLRFRLQENLQYLQVWRPAKMSTRRKRKLQATERETVRQQWMQRLRPMPHRRC
ncbi:hypothetical protein N7451_008868 [Penicillium sp. IBT 35674x]|nr:hypothetical protein N7451_008868 [Penicillium sp. IBT 35674x]